MQFNSKNCHILSITRRSSKPATTYTLGTEVLSQVDSCPYLGVTVSSDLRWHNHVSCISTKATRTLNFIRRNIHGCSADTKALAYTSLVRPHLEYAASAWDPYLAVDVSGCGCLSAGKRTTTCWPLCLQRLPTLHICHWSPSQPLLASPFYKKNKLPPSYLLQSSQ
jgi:hypothetical protein